MADEVEEGATYQLLTRNSDGTPGDVLDTSRNYDGKAVATHVQGDVYDGVFVAGKRNGHGKYTWKVNGDTFDGGYVENKRVGLGKYVYTDKSGKEGDDEGAVSADRGGVYHGNYDGTRNGSGTFTYVNGDSYNGEWKNGKKHGKGVYRYAKDGSSLNGKWVEGEFTQGKWIMASGVFFVGGFKWNQPIGEGCWVFPNGNQVLGTFTQIEDREEDDPLEDEDGNPLPPRGISLKWKSEESVAVRG